MANAVPDDKAFKQAIITHEALDDSKRRDDVVMEEEEEEEDEDDDDDDDNDDMSTVGRLES